MVRFIYSFVVGILFLNLQAYAMVNDRESVDPASVARCVRIIEKVGIWNAFGKDFAPKFRPNRTYFALALGLDGRVLHTFDAMFPSREELDVFQAIEWEFRRTQDYSIFPLDISRAYLNYLEAEDNYKAQKAERLAEERQRRLAEEEDNRRIAALSEKDSFITNVGKRIVSFIKFYPRSTPDFAEL